MATATPSTTVAPSTGTPYFMGDYALVKITGVNGYDPNIVWLADVPNKTLRPFSSDQALAQFYGVQDPNQLGQYINTIPGDSFGQSGTLSGFQLLDNSYAIQGNGYAKPYDHTPGAMQGRYGQQVSGDAENKATGALDSFINMVQSSNPQLAPAIQKYTNDPAVMASYISALAYGGYSLSDVYADLARRSLVDSGNTSLANVSSISATQPKAQYAGSAGYQAATSNPIAQLPSSMNVSQSVLNSSLTQIPDDAFKELSPVLDPNSASYKKKLDDATSIIYGAQLEMINAQTDQQRQMAMASWQQSKKDVEKNLGITLSNDAMQAWDQIESVRNNAEAANISGSGIESKQIDDFLKNAQRTTNMQRTQSQSQDETNKMNYYQNYASPAEVAALQQTDPQKAQDWGLAPNQAVKDYFSTDNLKKLYPTASGDDISRIQAAYLDPSGNMYSRLYNQAAQSTYNTQDSYNQFKTNKVLAQGALNEQNAESEYTTPDSPFLRDTTPDKFPSTPSGSGASTAPGYYTNLQGAGQAAISNPVRTSTTPNIQYGTPKPSPAASGVSSALSGSSLMTGPQLAAYTMPKPPTTPIQYGTPSKPTGIQSNSAINSNTIKLPNSPKTTIQAANPFIDNYNNNNSSSLLTGNSVKGGGGNWWNSFKSGVGKAFSWL